MQQRSRGAAVIIAGCALAAALFSGPVQARDNDRDRNDTGRYQQNDRNYDRGRHNGYSSGQYRSNYRGNGDYRRGESPPFAYIGAAEQRRYSYARRHRRHRRHHD